MCASIYSSLLLFILATTLTISIMCGPKMATGGLPLGRRERGADHDILAGADFLSVLIESSLRRAYSETTTTTTTTTTLLDLEDEETQDTSINYIRTPRETSPFAQTSTEVQSEFYDATLVSDSDAGSSVRDGVVVEVSVSSSVGRTVNREPTHELEYTSLSETLTEPPTTELFDQSIVASEDHPSIIAKSSKSELSVEESEPITRDSHFDFGQGYPARVRQLPNPSFNPASSFSHENSNAKPIHSTLIFHDSPEDPSNARSVSYSTVIQHPHLQTETEQNSQQHERRERNYNGAHIPYVNNYDLNNAVKPNLNETKAANQPEKSEMSTSSAPFSSTPGTWEKNEENHEEPTRKGMATTEQNWEMQEKPYSPPPSTARQMPKVYAQAEQNYEVDEAVSVVTNGRAHGVQPSLPPNKMEQKSVSSKKDDNQKVGYVVEGRNYRKYRVEERTADGFIVGEYGVVSHDDGSLRGVRYTADGTINPRLIYDALMKFLSL